jgi:TRAP-type C4-dicarboxylate transport system substrate-binding protein
MSGSRHRLAIVIAAAAALAACSLQSEGTKAGGSAAQVTLSIGTDDYPGRAGADAIEEFARRVKQASRGRLQIEPVWNAGGRPGPDDWDQVVARKVVSGEFDMGVIPARAWDTEGITSMRALTAPFLVTSDELVNRIVTSNLAAEMLSGLDTIGVTGLALLPESLRHVFAFDHPLLSMADFKGATIRAPRSNTTFALFKALGATPDPLRGGDGKRFEDGVHAGSVAAAESDFFLAADLPAPATATGNLTFFPKLNSLVINSKAFDELSHGLQAVVREAAKHTLDWAIANERHDRDSAKEFCNRGGTITTATDGDLAVIAQAARPVYDELKRDAATKAMLERISDFKAQLPPPATVAPCDHSTGKEPTPAATSDAKADQAAFPNGVYRKQISAQAMTRAGVSEQDARNHAGVWTLTFRDGQLTISDVRDSDDLHSSDTGTYCVANGRVSLDIFGGPACGDGVLFSAAWALHDVQLRFTEVRPGVGEPTVFERTLWGSQPWTKID